MTQAHEKYSLEDAKKIPKHELLKIIQKGKDYLKKNEVMKKICQKYNQPVEIIDYFPVTFGDIDVSAKTDHGIVILNYKLLLDGDFFKDYSYLVHEFTHVFQQCFRDKPTPDTKKENYLDDKFEQEGFKNQVEFLAEEFSDEMAEEYVDDLLSYHEIPKKEKDHKKEILLSQVDED